MRKVDAVLSMPAPTNQLSLRSGKLSVPLSLLQLIQDLHQRTKAHVPVGGLLSQSFDTASGVDQGCILAPSLFWTAIDWIMSQCASSMGITVCTSRITDQDYADDAVLFSDCPATWPEILTSFDDAAQTMGLHTSLIKTKLQDIGCGPDSSSMCIQGRTVEVTKRFSTSTVT